MAVGIDLMDLKKSGQFEEHRALPALPYFHLQRRLNVEPCRRLHLGLNLVAGNVDCVRSPSLPGDGIDDFRTLHRPIQSKCGPHIEITGALDDSQLPGPHLLGCCRVVVKVKSPESSSLEP